MSELEALRVRDEVLQAMYWMSAGGLADRSSAAELAGFLAVPAQILGPFMLRFEEEGYLDRDGDRFQLTEKGIELGKRSFADEFAELERVQALGFNGSDPGGLYRALRALEKEELVRSVWGPSESGPDRRTYEITRAGMEELHRNAKAIAAGHQVVGGFLSRYEEFVALSSPPRSERLSRSGAPSAR